MVTFQLNLRRGVHFNGVLLYANGIMQDSLKATPTQKLPHFNRAIISDILLWLALALLLAYGVYFFAIVLPAKRGQTFTLNFHNANEISKGSPVRLMGTDIGFVSDLRIRNDHVEVTIQTNPGALKIPSGSSFDILFTGLGGAKSVEISAPATAQPLINGQPIYLVQDPIRMQDVLNASIDVTQALQKGAENITDFFGKKKPVEELQFNIREIHQMSDGAVAHSGALNRAIRSIHQDIQDNSRPAIATLNDLSPGLAYAAHLTQPASAKPELKRYFQSIQKLSQLLRTAEQGALNTVSIQQKLTQFNQTNTKASQSAQAFSQRSQQAPLSQWLNANASQSTRITAVLDRATKATQGDILPSLQRAHNNMHHLNQQLTRINTKISQPPATPPPTP